jgi:hypothetical protein
MPRSAVKLPVRGSSGAGLAQTPAPPTTKPTAPGLIKLTGDDERRAKELDEQIDKGMKADRWDEAIAKAKELLALRAKVQGLKHFETVNAEWRLKALRRVASMPHEDRVAYQSAQTVVAQTATFVAQGKYAQAQPLQDKALEIHRRLFTNDHPCTAQMMPVAKDEQNPLPNNTAPWEDLIMWLAYKKAKAMVHFDAALAAPDTPDRK